MAGKDYQIQFERSFLAPRYWGTWLVLGVLRVLVWCPRRLTMTVGAGFGWLYYRLNAKRRRIAAVNLDLCFPELSQGQRDAMVLAHFKRFGQAAADLGLNLWATKSGVDRLTHIRGVDAYLDLHRQGRNVILLTPHMVGMDFGGVYVSSLRPAISMMKAIRNPLVNWMTWRARTRHDGIVVLRDDGLRPLLRAIKDKRACYYIPDGDFGAERSVFVPFLDIPTATITTLGRMASATDAAVVPCFTRLDPENGTYHIELRPPLEGFPTGDRIEDARRMNEALEAGVKLAPEQYIWTLKWFKTRPDGAPEPY